MAETYIFLCGILVGGFIVYARFKLKGVVDDIERQDEKDTR